MLNPIAIFWKDKNGGLSVYPYSIGIHNEEKQISNILIEYDILAQNEKFMKLF